MSRSSGARQLRERRGWVSSRLVACRRCVAGRPRRAASRCLDDEHLRHGVDPQPGQVDGARTPSGREVHVGERRRRARSRATGARQPRRVVVAADRDAVDAVLADPQQAGWATGTSGRSAGGGRRCRRATRNRRAPGPDATSTARVNDSLEVVLAQVPALVVAVMREVACARGGRRRARPAAPLSRRAPRCRRPRAPAAAATAPSRP